MSNSPEQPSVETHGIWVRFTVCRRRGYVRVSPHIINMGSSSQPSHLQSLMRERSSSLHQGRRRSFRRRRGWSARSPRRRGPTRCLPVSTSPTPSGSTHGPASGTRRSLASYYLLDFYFRASYLRAARRVLVPQLLSWP